MHAQCPSRFTTGLSVSSTSPVLFFEGSPVGFIDASWEVTDDATTLGGDEALLKDLEEDAKKERQAQKERPQAQQEEEPNSSSSTQASEGDEPDDDGEFFDTEATRTQPNECSLNQFFDLMKKVEFKADAESEAENFESLKKGLLAADYWPYHFSSEEVRKCLEGATSWADVHDNVKEMIIEKDRDAVIEHFSDAA